VIVKIDRGISDSIGDYDIHIDKTYHNEDNNNENNKYSKIEGFTGDVTKEIINTTIDTKNKKTSENVQYPDHDNIVRYGQYTCKKETDKKDKIEPAKPPADMNVCKNEFIYNNNSYRRISGTQNVENCNYVNDDMNDIDYGEYYRSKISVVKSYFEDPKLRGYNVLTSDNYAGINEIGQIDLTKKSQHPGAYNILKN
jgi:hypothetical protein